MAVQYKVFQPGKILHDSISGAMRQRGFSFDKWCRDYGVLPQTAKQATHGQMCGPKGIALLDAMVEAAGPDQVELSYRHRMIEEADRLKRTAGHGLMAAA